MTDSSNTYQTLYQTLVDRAIKEAEQSANEELSRASFATIRCLGFTEGNIIAEYPRDSVEKYIEFKKKEAVERLNASLLDSVSSGLT